MGSSCFKKGYISEVFCLASYFLTDKSYAKLFSRTWRTCFLWFVDSGFRIPDSGFRFPGFRVAPDFLIGELWSYMYWAQFLIPFSNFDLTSLVFIIVRYIILSLVIAQTHRCYSNTDLSKVGTRNAEENPNHFFHLFRSLHGINILLKCACFTNRCRCKFEHYLQRQSSSSCQFLLCHTKCKQWLWSYHLTVGSRYIVAYTTYSV